MSVFVQGWIERWPRPARPVGRVELCVGRKRRKKAREVAKDGKERMGSLAGHLHSCALWLPGSLRLHSPQCLLTVLRGDLCVCLQDRQIVILGGRGGFICLNTARILNLECRMNFYCSTQIHLATVWPSLPKYDNKIWKVALILNIAQMYISDNKFVWVEMWKQWICCKNIWTLSGCVSFYVVKAIIPSKWKWIYSWTQTNIDMKILQSTQKCTNK